MVKQKEDKKITKFVKDHLFCPLTVSEMGVYYMQH